MRPTMRPLIDSSTSLSVSTKTPDRQASLVHRSRRNRVDEEPRTDPKARWRDRDSTPHGVSGRILYPSLRRGGSQTTPTDPRDAEDGIAGRSGNDGTRVASYHPWTCLWWLVTGKTVGGTMLHDQEDCLSREEALRLYTQGSAWFRQRGHREGNAFGGQLCGPGGFDRRLLFRRGG